VSGEGRKYAPRNVEDPDSPGWFEAEGPWNELEEQVAAQAAEIATLRAQLAGPRALLRPCPIEETPLNLRVWYALNDRWQLRPPADLAPEEIDDLIFRYLKDHGYRTMPTQSSLRQTWTKLLRADKKRECPESRRSSGPF
jgi:hypothetical protein